MRSGTAAALHHRYDAVAAAVYFFLSQANDRTTTAPAAAVERFLAARILPAICRHAVWLPNKELPQKLPARTNTLLTREKNPSRAASSAGCVGRQSGGDSSSMGLKAN